MFRLLALACACALPAGALAQEHDTLVMRNPHVSGQFLVVSPMSSDSVIGSTNTEDYLSACSVFAIFGYIYVHPELRSDDRAIIRAFFSKDAVPLVDSVGLVEFTPWMPWKKASYVAAPRFAERQGAAIMYCRGPDEIRYTWLSENSVVAAICIIFGLLVADVFARQYEYSDDMLLPLVFSVVALAFCIISKRVYDSWGVGFAIVVWTAGVATAMFLLRRGASCLMRGIARRAGWFRALRKKPSL